MSAEKLGHEVRVVDYLRCYMNITSKKPTVIFRGEKLEDYDAVITRIGASYTYYGAAVVRQFEMAGLYTINRSKAITRSRDKLRSLQILAREGIGLPVTGFANHTADIDGMIDTVEGIPLVIKLLEGTQGKGVVLAETKKAASSVLSAFRQLKANILVQEFIKEVERGDKRIILLNGEIVGSINRVPQKGESRSNMHVGGKPEKTILTKQDKFICKEISQSLKDKGLYFVGVDIIGEYITEINVTSPTGIREIKSYSSIIIEEMFWDFIEKKLNV